MGTLNPTNSTQLHSVTRCTHLTNRDVVLGTTTRVVLEYSFELYSYKFAVLVLVPVLVLWALDTSLLTNTRCIPHTYYSGQSSLHRPVQSPDRDVADSDGVPVDMLAVPADTIAPPVAATARSGSTGSVDARGGPLRTPRRPPAVCPVPLQRHSLPSVQRLRQHEHVVSQQQD